jgi:hypothetical protein
MQTDTQMDWQTDRYDEANSCFSQLCENAKNIPHMTAMLLVIFFKKFDKIWKRM